MAIRNIPSAVAQQAALQNLFGKTPAPLDSLIQGFQQGVALEQLPQTIQQDALNQQLALALKQAQVEAIPLQRQQQELALQQLVAQLDPNYAAQQNAQKIAFDTARERSLLGVRQEFEKPVLPPKITANPEGDFIVRRDSQTGEEVGRDPIQKGKRFTDRGALGAGFIDESTQQFTPIPGTVSTATNPKLGHMQGYDEKTGTFGIFTPDENGRFPEGIIPSSQAPKAVSNKPIPITQSDQFTGLNLLDKRLDEIEKTPQKVRKSNVGWIDSSLGALQSLTGLGKKSTVQQNDAFRTAVDSLVGEFSFGRGGKALTVNEKEILGKYLPSLINSNNTFESRIKSFRQLVNEFRQSRIESLDASGYDVSKFRSSSATAQSLQDYASEEEARQKGAQTGDIISIGGEIGRLK